MNRKIKLIICVFVAFFITIIEGFFFSFLRFTQSSYAFLGLLFVNNILVIIGGYKLASLLFFLARQYYEKQKRKNIAAVSFRSEHQVFNNEVEKLSVDQELYNETGAAEPASQPVDHSSNDLANLHSSIEGPVEPVRLPVVDPLLEQLQNPPICEMFHIVEKKEDEEGYIIATDDVQLHLRSSLDVHLVATIFIRGIYNYIITEPSIVVDIGANVGYSTVWFANNEKVIKVFAYEPVRPNFEKAEKLVQLNPKLMSKIKLVNVGLFDENKKTSIIYFPNHHTVSSLYISEGNEGLAYEQQPQYEEIVLENAQEVLQEIIEYQREQNCKLILKIDCEGAEHNILNIFDPSVWASIDVILMEGHGRNYYELNDLLIARGFSVFSINNSSSLLFDHGCDIYAVRKRNN